MMEMMVRMMMMILVRMGEVETYTSLAPVGALTQEYRGLLVVSKVFPNFGASPLASALSVKNSRLREIPVVAGGSLTLCSPSSSSSFSSSPTPLLLVSCSPVVGPTHLSTVASAAEEKL